MNATLRRKLLWLHTWSGLTIGLIVVFLGVTGAIFVLRPQLERVLHEELLIVPACPRPLALDTFTARARAAHPAGVLESLEISADPRASIAVKFTNDDYVYLNPCTGAVLGMHNAYDGLFGTADWLHRFWFMDETAGKNIAGWSTAVFAVLLIVGGVVLWWPSSVQAARSALKFNPRLPGSARTLSLHRVAGLYTSVVLLALAVTALPISFPPIKQLIYDATGYDKPDEPRSTPSRDAPRLSLQALWTLSRALVPQWEWMSLSYTCDATDPVEVQILEPGAPHKNAKSHLYLDAYSGAPLDLSHYSTDVGLGRKIYLYCIALHAGLVWGLPYQLLLFVAALAMPLQAYSGFSPYLRRKLRRRTLARLKLKVVGKREEALDICSFELADPAGKPLPPFTAGSHIEVELGAGVRRQYSLCNDPAETHRYIICVLLHPESRGGSSRMHEGIRVGDLVEIGAPKNFFPLVLTARRSLLIGGGIGITPIISMAATLAAMNRDFDLHYCVRSRRHAALLDRMQQSTFASRVTVHGADVGGRLDIETLLDAYGRDTHIYVCGPNRLTDAVIAAAQSRGWLDTHIHREYFTAPAHDARDNTAFDVRIHSTGELIHVPADKSIVTALAERSIHIPTSCAEGVCGTCLTRVIAGQVEHRDMILTAEERARNDQLTPCCSRARGAVLTLDL